MHEGLEQNQETIEIPEKEISESTTEALRFLKSCYDIELNNFELLRLRQIAKEVIKAIALRRDEMMQLFKNDTKAFNEQWRAYTYSHIPRQFEIPHRFMQSEFGMHPHEFPEENDSIPEDFKKYLKLKQKRSREGIEHEREI